MNPFEWMPRPGEGRKLPNGITIWCKEWKTHQFPHNRTVRGEITFEFYMDEADYVRYTGKEQGELDPRLTQ